MKRMKKMLAFVLAMVMTFAMTVTAFGATEATGTKITVTNLSTRENTSVSIYKVAELAADGNSWVISGWAKQYVNTDNEEAVFNWTELAEAAQKETADETKSTNTGSVVFDNVATGAYLVLAQGEKVRYSVMGAVTYEANPYIVAKDSTVVAKPDSSTIEKEADDSFVQVGQEVNFTITSTIPYNKDSFVIYDKMTNLEFKADTLDVTVGGEKANVAPTVDEDGKYVFDFKDYLAETGKTVLIKYTATVVAPDGYVNTTWDNITGEDAGVTVKGYTADLTVVKVDAKDQTQILKGAKFKVLKGDKTLKFELVETGVYKLSNAADAVEEIEATEGTVKVMGLDEGTYKFVETLAPVGYSVNSDGVEFTVAPNDDTKENISLHDNYLNTKLSTLPFTGGMGTTIFTIVGCLVMIIAAGLFFANRRKAA
ncbi:MAG: SpaA isopeptide-forming pilin-related protein [Agathobacter sp.]|nr:SpaA isopeptide-forming pilin-related protein [Agathobacter sp.]